MAFIKIWVHTVWSTKNRIPFLEKEIRKEVFEHIKANAQAKGIYIDFINGYVDHIHCLIALRPDQNIAKIMQLIKGESAFWINKQKLTSKRFAWQEEYFAVSVSESQINKVREYIKNQESHHQKVSFEQEHQAFVYKYKFEKVSG